MNTQRFQWQVTLDDGEHWSSVMGSERLFMGQLPAVGHDGVLPVLPGLLVKYRVERIEQGNPVRIWCADLGVVGEAPRAGEDGR